MSKGDIVLIQFPFTDLSGSKLRPAIVLIDSAEEHQFDLSDTGAGLYLLVWKADESSTTVKVEVQR